MSAIELTDDVLRAWALPEPHGEAGKEERGRVLVVAGSREIPGAAVLAATAALRAGAGKLQIAAPGSMALDIAMAVPEARVIAMPETSGGGFDVHGVAELEDCASRADVVLVGPGMMDAATTCKFVHALLPLCMQCTVVLDAQAMDVARDHGAFSQSLVLTPHAGEMAHLSGEDSESIAADPQGAAQRGWDRWHGVVVLKGATTCIAAGEGQWVHRSETPGLGTSGSGDVLAGIIAGLCARGATPAQAAAWGVALHARAGQRLSKVQGPVGYLARELAAEIPRLMAMA